MKPLPSALLTPEDIEIWDRFRCRMVYVGGFLVPHPVSWRSFHSDRRDAELMFYAQIFPRYGWVRTSGDDHLPIRHNEYVLLRGGPKLGAV